MEKRLLGTFLLVLAAGGCVHLSPEVKAELEPAAEAADNNFARDSAEQQPVARVSDDHATR